MVTSFKWGRVLARNSMWPFRAVSDGDPDSPSLPMSKLILVHLNLRLSRSWGFSITRPRRSPSFSISRFHHFLASLRIVKSPTSGLNGWRVNYLEMKFGRNSFRFIEILTFNCEGSKYCNSVRFWQLRMKTAQLGRETRPFPCWERPWAIFLGVWLSHSSLMWSRSLQNFIFIFDILCRTSPCEKETKSVSLKP